MHPDRRARLERNLRLYPVLHAVVFTPFMLPIIVLFWEDNGLDLQDVFVLQSLFAVGMVVLEVPTGMVADRMGKRTSLLAGTVINLVGMAVYASGTNFAAFLVAELLLALGVALLSGADSALLYDSLDALGRKGEFTRRDGRARAVQMVSFAAANLIGGFIGAWSLRAAVWATVLGPALAFFVILRLTEVQEVDRSTSLRDAARAYGRLVGDTTKFVRKHRLVRWQIGFLAILVAGQTWLLWLYQPYMEHVGLPVWAFGFAFAAFNLFAAFASHHAAEIDERLGQRGTLVFLAAIMIVPPLLMAVFVHPLAILLVFGHLGARGVGRVIINARLLKYTFPDKRSTVLSVSSLSGRLVFAVTAPFMGFVAEAMVLPHAVGVQGATLLAAMLAMALLYVRIDPKYFVVKDR